LNSLTRGIIVIILLSIGLIEDTFGTYIYRKFGFFDIVVAILFIYFSRINENKSILKYFLPYYVLFFISSLSSGLLQNNLVLSGGYIHFLRNYFMTIAGFVIGYSIIRDKRWQSCAGYFMLIPIIIIILLNIKFANIGVDVAGAYDVSKLDLLYENLGFFQWNNISAVASLSLFLILIPKLYINNKLLSLTMIISALYIIVISISRTAFTTMFVFIFSLIVVYSSKVNFRVIGYTVLLILSILFVFQMFWHDINYFFKFSYSSFYDYKVSNYQQDLIEVRYQKLFLGQFYKWLEGANYWVGLTDAWGHSVLVTLAFKGGIITLILGTAYHIRFFQVSKFIQSKKTKLIYLIYFIVLMAQSFVADYVSTTTYYSFIAYLFGGIIFGSKDVKSLL
jgi:hypothetical protein